MKFYKVKTIFVKYLIENNYLKEVINNFERLLIKTKKVIDNFQLLFLF